MIDPRVASGLRDLTPAQALRRERMLARFRDVFARYGYLPIETPHIERMEVLTGKGAGSEEVLRQIFEVTNKGGTPGELALRFDLTVPLARFVARHVEQLGTPFKRYAMGAVFRGERPAKGRFREFTQCDFDTVGSESVVADAETVQVVHDALAAIDAPAFTIHLNDRRILDGLLETLGISDRKAAVLRALDKLSKAGREAVASELGQATGAGLSAEAIGRVLEVAERGRGEPDEVLGRAGEWFGSSPTAAQGLSQLRRVVDLVAAGGVERARIRLDLGLARGLDYYTGIVLETTIDGLERMGSVASGGRYDNLASLFTSRRLPGVGASIGLDRLLAVLEEAGATPAADGTVPVLVTLFPGVEPEIALRLAARLRSAGIGAEVFPDPITVGKQLAYGSNRGHRLGVIVGPDERERQVFNLRDLTTRVERRGLAWEAVVSEVRAALDAGAVRP
ncbi:MAG: histidine--tRNA ligase [Isosphaeraceae bacterium]|jgi:histidyl-tRNA synthetase|nr:MAG: histidine--tRNA ligase [Isosphaeraceae bacterium]